MSCNGQYELPESGDYRSVCTVPKVDPVYFCLHEFQVLSHGYSPARVEASRVVESYRTVDRAGYPWTTFMTKQNQLANSRPRLASLDLKKKAVILSIDPD